MLFIFALWSIMGLDTYCCLIFYGLTLIHLTDPLSQVVVQIMCVIYIYRGVCFWRWTTLSFVLFEEHSRPHTHTLHWTEFWETREEFIDRSFSDHHALGKQIIGYQRRAEMASQSTNQGNGLNFAGKCMLNCQHVILCYLNFHHRRLVEFI